jgi:hypothetical protein
LRWLPHCADDVPALLIAAATNGIEYAFYQCAGSPRPGPGDATWVRCPRLRNSRQKLVVTAGPSTAWAAAGAAGSVHGAGWLVLPGMHELSKGVCCCICGLFLVQEVLRRAIFDLVS